MAKKIFKYVWNVLKKNRISLILYLFFMVGSNILGIFINVINQITFDIVFYKKNLNYLLNFMIYIIIFCFLCLISLSLVNKYLSVKLYLRVSSTLKINYFDNIIRSDILFLRKHKSSSIQYRMFNDINTVSKYVIDFIVDFPVKFLYVILATTVLLKWSPLLTIVFYILTLINVLSVILSKKTVQKIYTLQKNAEQNVTGCVYEDLEAINVIRLLGVEKKRKKRMVDIFNEFNKVDIKNSFISSVLNIIDNLSFNIWGLVSIIIGACLVYDNRITIGEFISFTTITSTLSSVILSMLTYFFAYPTVKISYHRIEEYVEFISKKEYTGKKSFSFLKEMKINNLSYVYSDSNEKVLNNLSFCFTPEQIICLRGQNGSGKTTFQNIISRFYIIDDCEIYIDKIHINDIEHTELRKNLGYLNENNFIFFDSIINNITLDRENIDMSYIHGLLTMLNLDEIIRTLPNGINTVIGGAGFQLSLGSNQKVAIIRTLATQPKILILDEPTSNLDEASKMKLLKFLAEYKNKHQALIIIGSHDKDVAALSDKTIDFI